MTDVRTQVLRSWYGTPIVSHFMPSDEARAQRVVDMIAAEYVKRTPLSASGTSEMPPASVVPAEQPQRASTEDAGSAGGALPPWPKQQAILGLVHQDNPDFALPCEECLPRTRRIIKVYELALRARDERIAELERDLVAAKREAMVWRHRFTKETEVLPEREKLQDSLENQYACITSLEAENARLRERAEKAEYSARQFCGAHIGVPQPDCPVCGKPNIAAARRDEQGEAASPSPAAGSARVWSEEQRDAARSVARVVEDAASKIVDDGLPHISSPCVTRTCAELARVAPLFAAPAPVAVTRERLIATVNDAYRAHHGRENDPHVGFVNGLDVRIADAVLSALSAPVSPEDVERAVEAAWDARLSSIKPRFDGSERVRENWRKEVRAALASIGIATEGT